MADSNPNPFSDPPFSDPSFPIPMDNNNSGSTKPIPNMWNGKDLNCTVLVIPDELDISMVDLNSLHGVPLFLCQIIRLGKPKVQHRFEVPDEDYRKILSELLARGIRVINRKNLEQVNAEFIAKFPELAASERWQTVVGKTRK